MPNTSVQNTLPPMKRFIGSAQSTAGGRSKKTTLTKMKGFIGAVLNTCGPSQTIGGAQSLHVAVQRRVRTGQWKINNAKRLDVHNSRADDFSLDSGAQSFIHSVPEKVSFGNQDFQIVADGGTNLFHIFGAVQIQKQPWQRGCLQPTRMCGKMFCCIATIWQFRKRSPCGAYWFLKDTFFLGHPVPFAVQRWFG